uniref:Uncharacterized protein n=1 Tax=Rousettus aegyptiacus TaxID=9407 RepID=A0A7J8JG39_ROUAE|nr:hypothetical protein HJG63_010188 [Rousettus aegyptiacus]
MAKKASHTQTESKSYQRPGKVAEPDVKLAAHFQVHSVGASMVLTLILSGFPAGHRQQLNFACNGAPLKRPQNEHTQGTTLDHSRTLPNHLHRQHTLRADWAGTRVSRLLYPARLSFRIKGQMNFPGKKKAKGGHCHQTNVTGNIKGT